MKMYMSYSGDPMEGASLVFANNAREAKKLAWKHDPCCDGGDFTDVRVKLLKDKDFPWLRKEALKETPHVNDCPKVCEGCETWGQYEIGEDGYCGGCRPDDFCVVTGETK